MLEMPGHTTESDESDAHVDTGKDVIEKRCALRKRLKSLFS